MQVEPSPSAVVTPELEDLSPSFDPAGACGTCDLVREADHRIANHLSLLAGLVRLRSAELARRSAAFNDQDARLLLEGVGSQIAAIGRLHRLLATHCSPSADVSEHLHDLCHPLVAALGGKIRLLEHFRAGCVVRSDQVLPITQIVAEILTNALKHAYPAGASGVIRACCHIDEAGTLCVEIADDGPGFPASFNPDTDGGLGFRLLRARGKQLGAHMAFESCGDGLRFRLTLPVSPGSIARPY
jgi:two-component sensor histidine kinase